MGSGGMSETCCPCPIWTFPHRPLPDLENLLIGKCFLFWEPVPLYRARLGNTPSLPLPSSPYCHLLMAAAVPHPSCEPVRPCRDEDVGIM